MHFQLKNLLWPKEFIINKSIIKQQTTPKINGKTMEASKAIRPP